MRKAKLLIAVLVCSMMLMGVGYAWWTDSIKIFGNITTGEMKVQFGTYKMDALTDGTYAVNLPTITKSTDGKRYDCTFTNIVPGAVGMLQTEIVNTGTVPVKFDNIQIALTGSEVFTNQLQVGLMTPGSDVITYYSVGAFKNLMNNDPALKSMVIPKNGTFWSPEMYLRLNPAVGNDTQKQNGTFCVQFNWVQFDPMTDPLENLPAQPEEPGTGA